MQQITPEEHQAWLQSAPTQKVLAILHADAKAEYEKFLSAGPTATEEYLRATQQTARNIADLIRKIQKHHAN